MRHASSVSFLVTMASLSVIGGMLEIAPGISQALMGAGAMAVMVSHATRTTGAHRLLASIVAIVMAAVVFHGLLHAGQGGEASRMPMPIPATSGPPDLIRS